MRQFAALVLFACSLSAYAQNIRGVVQNITTNKPSVGDEVVLKKPTAEGMQDAGTTKTNAKGEFTFKSITDQGMYIVWVKHQDVTYTRRASSTTGPVAVRVYDSAKSIKEIEVLALELGYETEGDKLQVGEIFTIRNNANPPKTLISPLTFEFYLPEGAKIEDAGVQHSGNEMVLKTAVLPASEPNRFGIHFPLQPGMTQLQVKYTVPYNGKLKIDPRPIIGPRQLLVALPATIKFSPTDVSTYQPTNAPRGVSLFLANDVTAGKQTAFEIAGTGTMPQQDQAAQSQGGGQGRPENSGPGGGLGLPNEKPDPLHSGQWLFLGVLGVFLAAGAVYVFTTTAQAPSKKESRKNKQKGGGLLEAMKEEMFQLESDRIQGKLTPEEYETAKAALDKTLQRAVKRQTATK